MRAASTIAILCAFQVLVACGRDDILLVEEYPGDLDSETKSTTTPDAPGDSDMSVPPTETPAAPVVVATARTRTDLDDVEADAICAIRAKAAPGGTFAADGALPISSARDVSASLAAPNNLRLKFDFAPELSEYEGRPRRYDSFSTLEVFVPDGPKDALVVGPAITVSVTNFASSGIPCTTIVQPYGGANEIKVVSTTSKLTITSRSETQIEGALDLVADGKATHLTFRAPISDNLTPPAEICCLKPR